LSRIDRETWVKGAYRTQWRVESQQVSDRVSGPLPDDDNERA
jgi:hypothetical protein